MLTTRHAPYPLSFFAGGWLRRTLALGVALCALAATFAVRAEYANPHGVAVVIGNRAYTSERVPEVAYAHRDAEAFKHYVLGVLGFNPANVIDLRDATQAQMESAFGNERSHEGRVWRYLHPRHGSDVVVFYSGHGVPGLNDGRGYLLPADADPDSAKINGYPIEVLYANLGKLEAAKSVRVFLDACFSGDSDRGMLVRSASPVYVQAALPEASGDKLTVLAAASGKEVASWDDEAGHGLFTHYLLDALYGAADADGDGEVTAAEAKRYLDDTMTLAARREYGRHQNASLNGTARAVLASAGAGGLFPPRPALGDDDVIVVAGGYEEVEPSEESPEAVEQALGLTHAQRVRVQLGLVSLGYDVGLADGVFGRRTRAATGAYQKDKGLAETGYLTAPQAQALVALGEVSGAAPTYNEAWAAYERGDYAAALEGFRAQAKRGDPRAQHSLGVMYAEGRGVAQNDAEAVRWFRKAAEQGLADAQFILGAMYGEGLGVARNDAEAVRWYRKAAEQGHGDAEKALRSRGLSSG